MFVHITSAQQYSAVRLADLTGALVLRPRTHTDTAAPAIIEARRKAEERKRVQPIPTTAWPSERAWREAVVSMREVLQGDDVVAAREALRRLIGPARCYPAKDRFVSVELTTRRVLLAAGTGGGFCQTVGSCGSVHESVAAPRYHTLPTL